MSKDKYNLLYALMRCMYRKLSCFIFIKDEHIQFQGRTTPSLLTGTRTMYISVLQLPGRQCQKTQRHSRLEREEHFLILFMCTRLETVWYTYEYNVLLDCFLYRRYHIRCVLQDNRCCHLCFIIKWILKFFKCYFSRSILGFGPDCYSQIHKFWLLVFIFELSLY